MLGNLPSRAADNLFWFGRYLEREEATLRLVRCLCARAVDPDAPMHGSRQSIERLKTLLVAWGAIDAEDRARKFGRGGRSGAARHRNYGSALSIARCGALRRLGHPRAPDAADLATDRSARRRSSSRRPQRPLGEAEILDCVDEALTTIAALAGPVRREFQPRRGLDLLRARPAHRARHQHLPAGAPVRRARTPPNTISTCCSTSSTRRSPIARAP